MGGHFDGRQRVTGGSSGIGRQLQEQLNRALFFVTQTVVRGMKVAGAGGVMAGRN